MSTTRLLWAVLLSGVLVACGDHGHDHDHGDGDHSHGDEAHDHDDGGHGHGDEAHDHDDGGHGHGGGVVITHFTPQTELFVEFPPLAVGRPSPFAAHFTRLDSFAPVGAGRLVVRLSGGGVPDETFTAQPSATPGIFRPVATPKHVGMRRLTFELDGGDFATVHDVGAFQVYATVAEADASLPEEEEDTALIPFLKEQQWKVDFATAPVELRRLSASIPAPGVLTPAPGGEAYLLAPTDGLVLANGARFAEIGDVVEAGDVIALLSPHLGGEQDYAAIVADRASARAAYQAARSDRQRVEGLLAEGAVSQRRLEEARAAENTAKARLDAAVARLEAVHGEASGQAGFAIRSPVAGRIAHVAVGRGQFVNPGETLFRIVDPTTLRLTADVAEIDAVGMGSPAGAWFTPAGGDEVFQITDDNGRLIAAGGAVDPVKRTVPVVFEFDNKGQGFRAGTSVTARIRTGAPFEGPAIPASAIVDDAGQPVVFVMADAENWQRRVIRVALRDGAYVGVAAGLEPGERVASRGAYLIHLAASGPAEAGHGHVH